jgi:hypothetical protein
MFAGLPNHSSSRRVTTLQSKTMAWTEQSYRDKPTKYKQNDHYNKELALDLRSSSTTSSRKDLVGTV